MRWVQELRCVLPIVVLSASLAAQNVITTIAGVDPTFTGDGRLAASVPIGYINGVATDAAGNVYFTDPLEHLVLKVTPNRILSVIAGNGIAGYSGDGGPATSAAIAAYDSPEEYVRLIFFERSLGGIAIDQQGDVYFGDSHRVRMVSPQGIITTVAGGGTNTTDAAMPATAASLGIVNGLAFDSQGNLYFAESNRVRKMTPMGTLTTYAGTTTSGFSGDGGPAAAALLALPLGLAFDAQGNLYVADGNELNPPPNIQPRIRRITPTGVISTIAGGGTMNSANGVAPLNLNLPDIGGLAVDATGAVYAFGANAGLLFKISGTTSNTFTTTTLITSPIAAPFTADVQASTAFITAQGEGAFDNSGIAFDQAGNLYVADSRDGYLCKIDTTGFLTVLAGNGNYGFGGDGGSALDALIQGPTSMTQTPDGTIYFVDSQNARVRAISPAGVISTVLSPATYAPLGNVEVINAVVSDPAGNIYVLLAHQLIEVSPNGMITVIVNQPGLPGDSGDGGLAVAATIDAGAGLARDTAGDLYFSDVDACRIREVTVDGKIHTIAGAGTCAFTPDGATALGSPLATPSQVFLDGLGGIYIQESPVLGLGNDIIRYITPAGILKTIAGNGKGGFSGDGGPATQAQIVIVERTGLALDKLGNLYLADGFNHRVRIISPAGIINTYAGNGAIANAGDGGPPLEASLIIPQGLLFDAKGDLLISDVAANRIRSVLAAPPAISVSPIKLTFSGKSGGAMTPPQHLTIESPVSGLPFSVVGSPDATWMVLAATSGVTPELIDVKADPSNLAPGTYTATLTVSSPSANPVNTNIAVVFQVAPPSNPKLAIDKTGLSFTFPRNPTTTSTQLVLVSNSGTGTLAFSAQAQTATGGNWLSVSPSSGSVTPNTPANLSITANPHGLAAGTYTGTVTVASASSGDSDTVMVNLTVSTLDQAIKLSHTGLSFTSVNGGGIVPPGNFGVSNIGRGTMNFTVSASTLSGGQQWLSATPTSGTATSGAAVSMVTVTVNQAGLAAGFYYGLVRVDAPGAANSPQVATIVMQVLAAGQDPGPVIVPSEIVVNAVQGAPPPGSQNLFLYNVSATPQTYVSSISASNSSDQFLFDAENATLSPTQPTRLVVQPLTSGLAAGVYEAQLTLQFSDGNVSRVGIRTVVTPAPAGASSNSSDQIRTDTTSPGAAGCTPSQLVPVITTLGQSFGVPAAWPVALETQVQDDCGNLLVDGSVKVSFSNGDPPLSLESMQSGLWDATWLSGNSSGPVTLTVTAIDTTGTLTGTREVTGGLGNLSGSPVLSGAVSGASFAADTPLSPGGIISLFGQNLANGTASASSVPLTDTLADASVVMAGNTLPLLYSSSGQINAVVSTGINLNTNQQILVQRGTTYSVPVSVDVGPSEPAIFAYPAPGDPPNQGAIVNAVTYAVAQPATPVTAGDVLAIFCTGLGAVSPPVPDGAAATASPLSKTVATPTVTIGAQQAQVTFSGLAPGFVGFYQIDAIVPSGVTPGNQVPVVVSIAGETGPPATIALK
jgi:uncharacterized protein (TIGR03437 family)